MRRNGTFGLKCFLLGSRLTYPVVSLTGCVVLFPQDMLYQDFHTDLPLVVGSVNFCRSLKGNETEASSGEPEVVVFGAVSAQLEIEFIYCQAQPAIRPPGRRNMFLGYGKYATSSTGLIS